MKYVSVDLETTGLDVNNCQVIEFAAVYDDGREGGPGDLPRFHAFVKSTLRSSEGAPWYAGEPYALAMHSRIFKALASKDQTGVIAGDGLFDAFAPWLYEIGAYKEASDKVTVAGKNFAGFDLRFLRRMEASWDKLFHHRVIDPAMMFMRPDDTQPPSLDECLKRAGLESLVQHTAMDDAIDVVRCIRAWKSVNMSKGFLDMVKSLTGGL